MTNLLQGPRIQLIKATFHANGDPAFLHPPDQLNPSFFNFMSDERSRRQHRSIWVRGVWPE